MTYRTATFVSIILVGVAGSVALIAAPGKAHAEECLAGPKGAAPQGSHWYYRVHRASKRNCWYVRESGPKPAQSATAAAVPAATSSPSRTAVAQPNPAQAQRARPQTVVPLQPAVANARAEYAPMQDAANAAAPPAAPAGSAFEAAPSADPQAGTQRWSLASRWSDQGDPATADDQSAGIAVPDQQAAASDATPMLATNSQATSAPVQSTIGSIWMLLSALIGALALAGALVGTIIKFGNASQPKVRRDANGRPDIWGAAANEGWAAEHRAVVDLGRRVVAEEQTEPPMMNWIKIARERHTAATQSDEIERLLAQAPRRPA
jgi:hypothetical protein